MDTQNTILFLGDVAPYKHYVFRNSYRTVINLECPITSVGKPAGGKIILGTAENHLPGIFNSSLLCVNLANNHILDYGSEGLTSTIDELERSGISYFGINSIDGNNPLIMNFHKLRIAFLSAVCKTTSPILDHDGANHLCPLDPMQVIRKIKSVRDKADRIVVYLHHGEEESSLPSPADIKTARHFIDSGANIVIGSHAHSPQPVEKYNYGIIAYNLGNFIMPEMKDVPSYYDEMGNPGILFNSSTMLWNRISWGVLADMVSMQFKIKKFMFLRNRIIELPFTPFDRYLRLPDFSAGDYPERVSRHQKSRNFKRRIYEFIYNPHIPETLKIKL